jgi:excisionase family DNA binding protein
MDKGDNTRDKMMNTVEAAEYLGVSPATLEAWRCRGGSPIFLKLGKAVRYSKKSLDTFTAARSFENTSQVKKG